LTLRTQLRATAAERALTAALVLTSLASACAKDAAPPTEIIVVIDSDLAMLERVRLEVDGFGDGKPLDISLARNWLPRTVALLHQGGPMGPIRVTASGFIPGQSTPVIVEPREQVFFERGRVRALRIELLASCVGACPDGQGCVDVGGPTCKPASALRSLRDWTGADHVQALRPDLKHGVRVSTDSGASRDAGARDDAGAGGKTDAATGSTTDASAGGNADASAAGNADASTGAGGSDAGGTCANALQAPCGACGPVKRKLLTVNGTDVSEELSEFPLLVSLADADLAAALASGHDLCFTNALGDPLAFEIERWDRASGGLDAWVRVPTLRAGADTALYVYYGDGRDHDRSDHSAVWNSGYLGVYHMGSAIDATGNANDGAAVGTAVATGRIGDALSFNGADGHVDLSQSAFDDLFAGGATVEAWIRPTSFGKNVLGRIFDKAAGTLPTGGWAVFVRDNGVLANRSMSFGQSFDGSQQRIWSAPDNSIKLMTWQHVAVVYDSTSPNNDALIYLDGAPVTVSRSMTGTLPPRVADRDTANSLRIGDHAAASTRTFDGLIDEVRISSTVRSPAWLATEVQNQTSPGTFLRVGAEESIR
jgi:hypothetical protein